MSYVAQCLITNLRNELSWLAARDRDRLMAVYQRNVHTRRFMVGWSRADSSADAHGPGPGPDVICPARKNSSYDRARRCNERAGMKEEGPLYNEGPLMNAAAPFFSRTRGSFCMLSARFHCSAPPALEFLKNYLPNGTDVSSIRQNSIL